MSVYSGFATRTLEHAYDTAISNVISTLLVRITKFYRNEPIDEPNFFRIIHQQEKCLRKMETRKYLDPKYAQLLDHFQNTLQNEALRGTASRAKVDLSRTFSVLGREMRDIQATLDKDKSPQSQKIHQKHLRRRTKKQKNNKASLKSNIDIWDMRQEKMPQLPSLHAEIPERATFNRTKFNNFSQKLKSKMLDTSLNDQIEEIGGPNDSVPKVLQRPPKFRAKMFFK